VLGYGITTSTVTSADVKKKGKPGGRPTSHVPQATLTVGLRDVQEGKMWIRTSQQPALSDSTSNKDLLFPPLLPGTTLDKRTCRFSALGAIRSH